MVTVCDIEGMVADEYLIGDLADLIGKSLAYEANAIVAPDRQLATVRALLEVDLVEKGIAQ